MLSSKDSAQNSNKIMEATITAPSAELAGQPKYNPDGALGKAFRQGVREVFGDNAAPEPAKAIAEAQPKPEVKPAPAAPPPVKPPEWKPPVPQPADSDELANPPEGISDKGKSSWQKMRGKVTALETETKTEKAAREAVEKERDGFKTELERLKTVGTPEEVAALRKERDDFEQMVMQTNVELHPKFQSYFNGKFSTIEREVKAVAGDQSAAIMAIIQQPDGDNKRAALLDAIAALDPIAQQEVIQANAAYRRVAAERTAEVAKSRENFGKLAEQNKAQAEQQQAQVKANGEKLWKESLAKFSDEKEGLPVFRKIEGEEAWNAQVDENTKLVEQLMLGRNKPEQLAEAAFFSVYGRRAHALLGQAAAENAALRKQITDLQGASPAAPGGEKAIVDSGIPPIHDPGQGSWAQRTAKAMRGEIAVELPK